ncbi:MAG: carboxypeptidase regulatory-like domain-containing protein [Planctomycetes bacterium]|nr:carboxypeptidase regulatory-like domain-containing protein [Planctomycetota bacterium]
MRIASFWLFCSTSWLLAQAPRLCGVVIDPAGKPLPGAHVRVVPWVEPGVDPAATVDAQADAAGRFSVSLGSATGASVWAWSARLASPIAEAVPHMAELTLALEPIGAERLTIGGLAAWRDEGPLRARLLVPGHGPWTPLLPVDGQGIAALPPCPPGDLFVELSTSRSELLARLPVARGEGGATAELLPPVPVSIVVTDPEGLPLAGAVVRHRAAAAMRLRHDAFPVRSSAIWRQVGKSDAEGRVVARVPLPCDPSKQPDDARLECEFAVALTDHALGWAGFSGGVFSDAGATGLDDGALTVVLRPMEPSTVRVLRDGKPVVGQQVLLLPRSFTMDMAGGGFSFRTATWPVQATTSADGIATFPELPWEAAGSRLALLWADTTVPGFLPVPTGTLPEVDLAQASQVVVRVLAADGKPAAGVRGHGQPYANDVSIDPTGFEPRFATDGNGSAHLRLADGQWWLWVTDGEQFAHAMIRTDEVKAAVELRLQPLARWSVLVTTEDGKPAAGARFDLDGGWWIDGTPIPPEDELRPMQFAGNHDFQLVQCGRAGRDGRMVLRYLPPVAMHTVGFVTLGALRSEKLVLDPARLPATVVVRTP